MEVYAFAVLRILCGLGSTAFSRDVSTTPPPFPLGPCGWGACPLSLLLLSRGSPTPPPPISSHTLEGPHGHLAWIRDRRMVWSEDRSDTWGFLAETLEASVDGTRVRHVVGELPRPLSLAFPIRIVGLACVHPDSDPPDSPISTGRLARVRDLGVVVAGARSFITSPSPPTPLVPILTLPHSIVIDRMSDAHPFRALQSTSISSPLATNERTMSQMYLPH